MMADNMLDKCKQHSYSKLLAHYKSNMLLLTNSLYLHVNCDGSDAHIQSTYIMSGIASHDPLSNVEKFSVIVSAVTQLLCSVY